MAQYLFRVEAVNLATTIYDTSDISTIRGGGFYLLNRVHQLAARSGYQLITEGASTAVFKVDTNNPEKEKQGLLDSLYNGVSSIKEMMFLVEYIEYGNNFQEALAKLMGKLRLAQMRSPCIRVFEDTLKPNGTMRFDEFNRVLPAHVHDNSKDKDISNFTYQRREQGKTLRQKIYAEMLKNSSISFAGYDFTDSLEELSSDPDQGNLSGKIAYIYVDGNKFGALQKEFSEEDFQDYDQKLQGFKRDFLSSILGLPANDPSFLAGGKVRLETLLWGGDELKLIVPAWLGWKVASLFFSLANDPKMVMSRKDLTYAMGLVFAHHNNPIRNITRIAEELVHAVKGGISDPYKRDSGDRMGCLVLESLETLPASYETFCRDYYKTGPDKVTFSPGDMKAMQEFAALLKEGFPRSRVFKIAAAWARGNDTSYAELLDDGLDAYEGNTTQKNNLINAIQNVTQTDFINGKTQKTRAPGGYRWLQMAELFDYLT